MSLLHHLAIGVARADAWVKRRSFERMVSKLADTTLEVDGWTARQTQNGLHFSQPVVEEDTFPWAVSSVAGGFTIGAGRVSDFYFAETGLNEHTPKIGDTEITATPAPILSFRSSGVICVELQVQINRGAWPDVPLDGTNKELLAWPEIKWLVDVDEYLGVLDANPTSTGVFAIPLAIVTNGQPQRLRWEDIFPGFVDATNVLS